jgi:hypothetical protein
MKVVVMTAWSRVEGNEVKGAFWVGYFFVREWEQRIGSRASREGPEPSHNTELCARRKSWTEPLNFSFRSIIKHAVVIDGERKLNRDFTKIAPSNTNVREKYEMRNYRTLYLSDESTANWSHA